MCVGQLTTSLDTILTCVLNLTNHEINYTKLYMGDEGIEKPLLNVGECLNVVHPR